MEAMDIFWAKILLLGRTFFSLSLFFSLSSLDYNANSLEVDNEKNTLTLRGNAMIDTGDDTVRAASITNYANENRVAANGSVRIIKNDRTRTIKARSASFNYSNQSFSARDGSFEEGGVFVSAEEFKGNFDSQVYEAKKEGYFKETKDAKVEIWAENLRYEAGSKMAYAFGKVKVVRDETTVFAGQARYDMNNKIIEFWQEDEGDFKPALTAALFSEDDWKSLEASWNGQDEEQKGDGVKGKDPVKVLYVSKEGAQELYDAEAVTHYLRYYFKDHEIFAFDGKVEVQEKRKNLRLSAPRVFYYRDLNFYKTYGASVYEDLKQDLVIRGDRFEYYEDKDIVYSKGNSSLDYLERTVYSGVFLYSEKKNQALFYSSPYIVDKEGNRLNANVIRYDLNKNTLLFDGAVNGDFHTGGAPPSSVGRQP